VKKTSLYLDPDLDEALARRAADEGLTKAEFIRRTLAAAMQRQQRPKPHGIGIIKGGPRDLSENIERYLGETGFGRD
jgi:hypothetical protein